MNILQVCAFAAPSPGNFMASLLALDEALKKDGNNTIYAFPERARDKDWCIELQKTTKVYFLPEAHARIKLDTYKKFKEIYKENDIDIMHSHFELYDIPATVTAPKNVKIFWHLHDAIKDGYGKSKSRDILTKLQYGFFSKRAKLLTVSKKHGDFVAGLGFNKKNIEYIPNGINTDRIDIDRIDKNKIKNRMLLFGWEMQRKGVDLIVEASKKFDNDDFLINIIGQEECKAFLEKNDAPNNINFSYPTSDINNLYENTSVFLHISRAEGLSYALLEAIYAGLPVVCSDIPENMIAKEFKNIIWFKSGDVDDLVKAIKVAIKVKNNLKDEDIKYNRNLIMKKYSLNCWVKKIRSSYLA